MQFITKINNLKYAYNAETHFNFPDFEISAGQEKLILGKSGIGKSTLLHLLGLILRPKMGKIEMGGTDTGTLRARELSNFRARHIGLVFQRHHFIQSVSVLENLLLANYLGGQKNNRQKAMELAEALGIEALLHIRLYTLSGGERQRVGIARALMNSPKLVLADEPTANLDDENCERVHSLLSRNCRKENASLVIVTHDNRLKHLVPDQILLNHVH